MVLPTLLALAISTLPPNPTNITVYHVNQANYTGITNMNTADGFVLSCCRSFHSFHRKHNSWSARLQLSLLTARSFHWVRKCLQLHPLIDSMNQRMNQRMNQHSGVSRHRAGVLEIVHVLLFEGGAIWSPRMQTRQAHRCTGDFSSEWLWRYAPQMQSVHMGWVISASIRDCLNMVYQFLLFPCDFPRPIIPLQRR
jgi:hypothetical protein